MTGKRTERAAEWIYHGLWSVLVRWFRVPSEPPTLPTKPGQPIQSFQPDRAWLTYLKFWFWIALVIIDIALGAAYIVGAIALWAADLTWVALLLLPVALFIIVAPDIVAYIAIHLRYDTTWYVMTDRSLRIRRGIWVIHEMTITFENVQNIKLQQGPVQRYFGFANLIVETAGAGGSSHGKSQTTVSNQGVIEGMCNAAELRDRIMQRLRQSRSAGLGDEDVRAESAAAISHRGGPAWTPEHLAVLRDIRDELRQLAAA